MVLREQPTSRADKKSKKAYFKKALFRGDEVTPRIGAIFPTWLAGREDYGGTQGAAPQWPTLAGKKTKKIIQKKQMPHHRIFKNKNTGFSQRLRL